MPATDDFDQIDADYDTIESEVDMPTDAELAAARLILSRAGVRDADVIEIPDTDTDAGDDADDTLPVDDGQDDSPDDVGEQARAAVDRGKKAQGNRRQRRAAGKALAKSPTPRDHQKKVDARRAEADGDATIALTLWGEQIFIDRSTLADSWDWQLGMIEKNTLQMVKGLLGEGRFVWFCLKSKADNKSPQQAANELMSLFAEVAGVGTAGNS